VDQGTRITGELGGSGNENNRKTWWIRERELQENLVDQGTRITRGLGESVTENDRRIWWIRERE
jgi:hypothetical protein